MERDDANASVDGEHVDCVLDGTVEHVQLIVDGDADGLERPLRRMAAFSSGRRRNRVFNQFDEFERRLDRFDGTGLLNLARNLFGEFFFPVCKEDAARSPNGHSLTT